MVAAGVFDFFDGFVARLLRSASIIGKDLDSLADMVTFGLLPGALIFSAIQGSILEGDLPEWAIFFSGLVPVFSAVRLAIFNNDSRQSDQFIGVPTPANALFISFFLADRSVYPTALLSDPWILPALAVVCACMLVMPIPLIALKFKDFSLKNNVFRYGLIGLSLVLFVWLQFSAVPFIFLAYIALSILNNLIAGT